MTDKKHLLALTMWMLLALGLRAQLQVTPSSNAATLVNQLIGPGISVTNATINTQLDAAGTFISNGSNIGLPAGVLLTSGTVGNAVGPNINTGITTAHGSPGDPQLNALTAPFLTEDACILEFDMVATCDTIQISYVFGSDEYDEYVCTDFTDAFAFFISGPGIAGTQNIAVIPGSATPVSINTVNIGSVGANAFPPYPTNCNTGNAAYFTTNNTGTTVEYDGFTVPLIAKSAVIPCSTYHIKLVIADAGDASLDSGVFLEQGGIRCVSTAIQVASAINNPGYVNAIEGCVSGSFTFTRTGDTTQAQTVGYTVGGTATPAFDYPPLSGSVTFPAMVSAVTINITATADGLVEGTESVQLILLDSLCGAVFSDTATLFISDQIAVTAGPNFTLCQDDTVQIGVPPQVGLSYTWLPATSLSSGTVSNPLFHNPTPGNYSFTLLATDTVGCQGGDTMTVQVLLSPTATFTVGPEFCQGDVATITYTGNAPPSATYNWNIPGATVLSGSGQGPYQVRWLGSGIRYVQLQVSVGMCTSPIAVDTVIVHVKPVLTLSGSNPSCFGYSDGQALASVLSGNSPFTYAWNTGATSQNLLAVPMGAYSLTLTDVNGCRDTAAIVLNQPTQLTSQVTATQIICHGGTGTLSVSAAGGTPAYTYAWSSGGTTATATPTGGVHTVTVTDAQGCVVTESVTLVDPPQIGLAIVGDSQVCDYENIHLTAVVNGGVSPYTYVWTSIPTAVNDSDAVLDYVALPGTYVVDMMDSLGCTSQASLTLDVYPRPLVDFAPDIRQACDSATVTFLNNSVPAGSSYLWEFPDGSTSVVENPAHWFSNGIWGAALTVTSPEGCVAAANLPSLVTILPTPVASFITEPNITLVDYLLLSQASIMFINTSPFYAQSVDWSFGNGDSAYVGQVVYTYPAAGLYEITMTAYNAFGCHDDTTQSLLILDDPALWVPTGFTPNGDGLNDVFSIAGIEVKTFAIDIFDRWGKLVFHTDDISTSWDGRVGGEAATEGVYVYKIEAATNTGPVHKSGSVTLIR